MFPFRECISRPVPLVVLTVEKELTGTRSLPFGRVWGQGWELTWARLPFTSEVGCREQLAAWARMGHVSAGDGGRGSRPGRRGAAWELTCTMAEAAAVSPALAARSAAGGRCAMCGAT